MHQCAGKKRDGSQCTATVNPPQTYCWWHSEENAAQRKRAAAKGGRARGNSEIHDIKRQLRDIADAVLGGELDTKQATTAVQALNCLLRGLEVEYRLHEIRELEQTVTALETRAQIQGRM